MSNNDSQEDEMIVIEGTVDSISPAVDQDMGIHLARVLLHDDDGKQRNVQVSSVNVRITRTDKEVGGNPDEVPLRVRLKGKPHIMGGLSVETAIFLIPNEEYGNWVRKAFGFRRPGEDFEDMLNPPEDYMYGRC